MGTVIQNRRAGGFSLRYAHIPSTVEDLTRPVIRGSCPSFPRSLSLHPSSPSMEATLAIVPSDPTAGGHTAL